MGQHWMFSWESLDSEGFLSTTILVLPEELAGFELASIAAIGSLLVNLQFRRLDSPLPAVRAFLLFPERERERGEEEIYTYIHP